MSDINRSENQITYYASRNMAEKVIDNETVIRAKRIITGREGGRYTFLTIESADGYLGGGHLCLSDPSKRKAFCKTLTGKNGMQSAEWEDHLTAFCIQLEEALEQTQTELHTGETEIIDAASRQKPGNRRWCIQRLIPEGKTTSLFADGGIGKSYMALAIAISIAVGGNFLGYNCQQGPVLYLDWEEDEEEFTRRLWEVTEGMGFDEPPRGIYYRRATRPLGELVFEVIDFVQREGAALVIIDSFGAACEGEVEQSRDTIATMNTIATIPTTRLIVDHEPKPSKERGPTQFGSAYKKHLSRSQLRLEDKGQEESGRALILKHTKANLGPCEGGKPLFLRFEGDRTYFVETSPDAEPFKRAKSACDRVLEALKSMGEATANDIASETDLSVSTVQNALRELTRQQKAEVIRKEGKKAIYGT